MDNTTNNGIKLDVSVRPMEAKGNLLAFASVTINDCFKVHGFKVVTGEKGMFVDMPSAKTNQTDKDGKPVFMDVCHPITGDFRTQLITAVLDGYDAAIEKMQNLVQSADKAIRAPMKQALGDQLKSATQKAQAHKPPAQVAAAKRADVSL